MGNAAAALLFFALAAMNTTFNTARAQITPYCGLNMYWDPNYGCLPLTYFYGPPYYAYPSLGFRFFYGPGWGWGWRNSIHGPSHFNGAPHGGGVPHGGAPSHGGGGGAHR
jgi:hypothetical protein